MHLYKVSLILTLIDNCLAPAKPYSVTLVHMYSVQYICSFLPEFTPISITLKKEDSMRAQLRRIKISITGEPYKSGDRST